MKKLTLCIALSLFGCATPYAKVKNVHTIEEARALLGDYKPSVTPYPPDAEAWYFGSSECVLFVDGKLRLSKDSRTETQGGNTAKQPKVLCSPSAAEAIGPECSDCTEPYASVKKAKTIEEARALLGDSKPSVTPYPPNAEAWYFGTTSCVLFVNGAMRMSRHSSSAEQPVVCSPAEADANQRK